MFTAKNILLTSGEAILPSVVFDTQPSYATVSGSTANFSVSARSVPAGASLTYQWYRLPKSSGNSAIMNGETSSTLSLSGLNQSNNNGDSYRVKVTVVAGDVSASFSSSAASLEFTGNSFGGLYACGLNSQNGLGDGTTEQNRNWLVRTLSGSISEISVGSRHGFAIKNNELWGWGSGQYLVGLGSWSSAPVLSPQKVDSSSWSSVSAGGDHTLAIKTDGSLWGWGQTGYSDGRAPEANVPTLIDSGSVWSKISAGGGIGEGHSTAIKSNGDLFVWGRNNEGQLGLGDNTNRNSPTKLGSSSWSKISAGYRHTLAIKSDGTLWAWGYNAVGQVGDGTKTNRNSPVQIDGGSWLEVSAGLGQSLAIKSDGTLWSWGTRIGDGTKTNNSLIPKKISSDTWNKVSANGFATAAIKSDGTLWTWGDNSFGELSNGLLSLSSSEYKINSPKQVDSGNWSDVSFSSDSSILLAFR